MDKDELKSILSDLKNNKISLEEAMKKLEDLPFADLGFAKVDHHRPLRKNFSEVIFCSGKTVEQIVEIALELKKKKQSIMATRANEEIYQTLKKVLPDAIFHKEANLILSGKPKEKLKGNVLVVTGGTADIPVAEEAVLTAEFFGSNLERIYDVGVAGVHRLLQYKDKLSQAKVIIVIAGMEGALASVIAGLVSCPIIAVPTSVGYGASFGGLAALLTMLNSCAPGVAVVNIDNGFGAGYLGAVINRLAEKEQK